jgi:hypothetical protein
MRPETLQQQLNEILSQSFHATCHDYAQETEALALSDQEMFRLWNLLGEELGIDLSLVTTEQRQRLFEECSNGQKLSPKEFGSLLWLMYYSEVPYQ